MWRTIGQSKIVNLLQRAVERNSLSHAYLLVGPPQTGKMTLAIDLAMTLNCQSEKGELRPCQECQSCQKIAQGKHSDVQVIGLNPGPAADETREKTEIGIGQINSALHSANLPPFEGKYRIYIIEECGLMSLDAANRLLKTLEEPPANVIFILLAVNLRAVPATIISRCQKLNLSRAATSDIERLLTDRQVEVESARLLARLSHGCPGWAISASQTPNFFRERTDKFEAMLGLISGDLNARFSLAGQLVLQFARKREMVYEALDNWLSWWRDLLLVKTGCDSLVVNFDILPALGEVAGSFNLVQIKTVIQHIQEAREQLKVNANPRLVLEVLVLNLPGLNPINKSVSRV